MSFGRSWSTRGATRWRPCLAALLLLGGPACAPDHVEDDGVARTAHLAQEPGFPATPFTVRIEELDG